MDRMQVRYRETKTGVECIHLPSIDVSSVDPSTFRNGHGHQQMGSSDTGRTTPTHRPSLVKKASKLSFGMRRGNREPSMERSKTDDSSTGTAKLAARSGGSSSFFNVIQEQPTSNHDNASQYQNGVSSTMLEKANGSMDEENTPTQGMPPRSHSPTISTSNKAKVLPPIPRDFGANSPTPRARSPSPLPSGEVDREVFENLTHNTLSVRFEINIVKVCA